MSRGSSATAITVFHRSDADQLERWLARLLDAARCAPGFVSERSALAGPGLEPAVAVVFVDEGSLNAWLDGDRRRGILADAGGAGIWPAAADIVTADGLLPPNGVAGFRHEVAEGRDTDFLAIQTRLAAAAAADFPGFLGVALFPADNVGSRLSVLRFRTERQLADWLESDQRHQALPDLQASLTRDFTAMSRTTPFGTTVRAEHGRVAMTPAWKTAMLVLMILYPTVMLLSRFLGPMLDGVGAPPWLSMWLSQVVSIAAMQWWLMPMASRGFRRWLDPIEGRGWRVSAVGAAAIGVAYALTLALFATAHGLQYWDYGG